MTGKRYNNTKRLKEKVCHKCNILRPASDFLEASLDTWWFEGGLYDTCNPCFQHRNMRSRVAGIVNKAIKGGVLQKSETCNICGRKEFLIDGHHEDYNYPLYVIWLCRSCHIRYHKGSNSMAKMIQYWVSYLFNSFNLKDINYVDIKYATFFNKYYVNK